MNKKGLMELADLAGFILIFITVIIFGYIFLELSPKANIELLEDEYHDYEAKYELLRYLESEVSGMSMADWIVLKVKENDLSFIKEKSKGLFDSSILFGLSINGEELFGTVVRTKKSVYTMYLENLYGEDIYIIFEYYRRE